MRYLLLLLALCITVPTWAQEHTHAAEKSLHGAYGEWMTMLHGYANLIYDHQDGGRDDDQTFSESMVMVMTQRPLGEGTFGMHGMPLMGKRGYPLLFQTGETANGATPLIDQLAQRVRTGGVCGKG